MTANRELNAHHFSCSLLYGCSTNIQQQTGPLILCMSTVLHRCISSSCKQLIKVEHRFVLITHLWLWGRSWRWAGSWPSWRQTPRTRLSLWPRWGRAHWRRRTPLERRGREWGWKRKDGAWGQSWRFTHWDTSPDLRKTSVPLWLTNEERHNINCV